MFATPAVVLESTVHPPLAFFLFRLLSQCHELMQRTMMRMCVVLSELKSFA